MGKLLYEGLTYEIIGAAMEVHTQLGYGYLESVYERSLAVELKQRGVNFECQKQLSVFYKGIEVGHYVADIVVEGLIIVELKAVAKGLAKAHYAQTINYLTATGLKVGLLINFGKESIEHKRFVKSTNPRQSA